MKNLAIATPVLCLLLGCGQPSSNEESKSMQTETVKADSQSEAMLSGPVAKKVPYKLEQHGDTRIDEYYWMRDDARTDPEILAHLQAEEDYAQQQLAHTKALQDTLFEELTGRLQKDESSVPVKIRDFYYQTRYLPGKEYQQYLRADKADMANSELLLDVNELAKDKEYYALGDFSISNNDNLLAYSDDSLSRRVYTIRFKDLASGENLADELTGTNGQVIWANDNTTVFYLKKDLQTLLAYQVYRHTLGTPQSDDVLVYEEKDNTYYTQLGKSLDDQYIEIYHDATLNKGMSLIDANKPQSPAEFVYPIEANHEYWVQPHGDDFYILSNHEAENFRVLKANKKDVKDKSKWQEVVAHNPDVFIADILVLKNHLILKQRKNGVLQLKVFDLTSKASNVIGFDDPVYLAGFTQNVEFDTKTLRVYYASMTTPKTIFDVDLTTDNKTLLKQDKILGDFDAANYQSERIMVTARDGAKIPVSLVYRKDKFKKDGTNPVLQYAYGSYGSTIDPSFNSTMLSVVDRGFVYAIAHIRGSQMLGRPWYEDGKLLNKKNTFNDFVDVSKALVEQKYAATDKVFAAGGSAGGLLMGAVVNQAPELYLGIAALVPFVDVVTTMSDPSIPLTTNEYDEWGNPADKAYYDYMLSYSPYDNVEKKAYPNILVSTGLHDSQVQYFEPAKWVAKLRDYKTDDNALLFHVNMEAGHGGASGRYQRYKDWAMIFAFYLDLLGENK